METYKEFREIVKKGAEKFVKTGLDKGTVRIISHLDADGICAASILIKALLRKKVQYSLSIVSQLKEDILKELSDEEYEVFVFTDLGSGQLENIKKYLGDRNVFVLDHHTPNNGFDDAGIVHVNPHMCKINGADEISGAGVVYMFAKEIDKVNNDLANIAIIGAIGDVQEKDGFKHLNEEILKSAINQNKIEKTRSLRFFGAETKPLFKLLAYSTDPFIPGVSGSESRAMQFLHNIGINPKVDKKWRKLNNLCEKEMEALVSAIIIKRKNEEKPNDVLGNVYRLIDEEDGNPTKDAREFSTLLNACGRLNKASVGIGTCLGDEKSRRQAFKVLTDYKREIMHALNWYEKNKDSNKIEKHNGYILINAQDEVMGTIIGTLASIISHSDDIPKNMFILAVAHADDGTSKASLRYSGRDREGIDLKDVIEEIVKISGGESGGHDMAAGAVVPLELEEEFLKAAKNVLSKKSLEEVIVAD